MEITAALATDLNTLTQALDEPGTNLTATLSQLAVHAKTAVHSYLGLCVIIGAGEQQTVLTALENDARHSDIRTSLRMPLPPAHPNTPTTAPTTGPSTAMVLVAGQPGAFIDLAADLAWLTGRELAEFVLDADLTLPASQAEPSPIQQASLINQAIGVLIFHGHTPEQAQHKLHSRSVRTGVEYHVTANTILTDAMTPPLTA